MSIEVQVLVGGKPVKQYWHENNWFVEARKGANYEVKIKNNTHKRILAVVSIDGLSVLDGKSATSDSSGYVMSGYSSYSIKGFRVSNEEVNLFEFSDKSQSYAVKSPTGESSSANCGIIAVRVFEEKEKPQTVFTKIRQPHEWPYPHIPKRPRPVDPDMPCPWTNPEWSLKMLAKWEDENGGGHEGTMCCDWMEQERGPQMRSLSFGGSPLRSKGFDMGTKFSEEKVADRVSETTFEKGYLLQDTSIYYASRASLEEMGIKFAPEPKVALPSGFKDKYCQPPKR